MLGFMILLAVGVVFLAIVYAIFDSIVVTPAYNYDALQHLGEYTGMIFHPGMHFKKPFVEKVQRISTELARNVQFDVTFTSKKKDNLRIRVAGSAQYRPDPSIAKLRIDRRHSPDKSEKPQKKAPLDAARCKPRRPCPFLPFLQLGEEMFFDGPNTFIGISPDVIEKGIEETISSKIGGLGGRSTGEDFKDQRPAMSTFIDVIFRLENQPHIVHDPEKCAICMEKPELAAKFPRGAIGIDDVLAFYDTHWMIVKDALVHERARVDEHSDIELLYGIDIEKVTEPTVEFSDETQEAFEEERQAELRGAAVKEQQKLAEGWIKLGVTPDKASDDVQTTLQPGDVKKKVVSAHGQGGVLGALIELLPGQIDEKSETRKSRGGK